LVTGFGVVWAAIAGCSSPPPAGDTGARAVVQTYFEAVARRDWPAAYDALHPDSRKRWTLEQFTRAAENHRRAVGFDPEEVHINSCEEHDAEATAHVLLTGHAAGKAVTYKDAVLARQGDAGWGIVLPHNFRDSRPH
jgi:hypothetical protein